ncbi:hypothetical protein QF024_002779 [Chryseobacterium nepalense]|nr:hypothetical protein [Chryseobacterium nepalense]
MYQKIPDFSIKAIFVVLYYYALTAFCRMKGVVLKKQPEFLPAMS